MSKVKKKSAARGASSSQATTFKVDAGRPDQRYKDQDNAPGIVSEKRLTFFVPELTYRQLRLYAGLFQAANADINDDDDRLPESPSALLRDAVHFYLDQMRNAKERTRSEAEWQARFEYLRSAAKKFS